MFPFALSSLCSSVGIQSHDKKKTKTKTKKNKQQQKKKLMGYLNGHPWRVIRTGNSSYRGKFDQGKRNLVGVNGVFELSEFELTE